MRPFFVFLVPVLHLAGQGFPASYTVSTAAGSDWVGDQGPAISAILRQAEGLTSDLSANLYIADAVGHRIRIVSPVGSIRTLTGTGVRGFSGDGGPASQAQLDSPYGILEDPRGNLFVADLGNSRVRRIAPDGTITTIAGGGSIPAGGINEGSLGTSVALNSPRNLAMDSAGNLYISDFGAHRVYRLDRGGYLTTVAGTGFPGSEEMAERPTAPS
jgi:sugar lactone lactonase YvrE